MNCLEKDIETISFKYRYVDDVTYLVKEVESPTSQVA